MSGADLERLLMSTGAVSASIKWYCDVSGDESDAPPYLGYHDDVQLKRTSRLVYSIPSFVGSAVRSVSDGTLSIAVVQGNF